MTGSAEKGRVMHARIDDQVTIAAVASHGEAEASSAVQCVPALDAHTCSRNLLIGDGARVAQHTERRLDQQRTAAVECQRSCSGVGEADARGLGAGPNAKLVLQAAAALLTCKSMPGQRPRYTTWP